MKLPKFRELPWIKEIVDYRETKQAFGENFGEALRAQPELRKARLKCRDGVMKIVAVPVVMTLTFWAVVQAIEANDDDKVKDPMAFSLPGSPTNNFPDLAAGIITMSENDLFQRVNSEYVKSHPYLQKSSRFGGYINNMHKKLSGLDHFPDAYMQKMWEFLNYNTRISADPIPSEGETGLITIEYFGEEVINAGHEWLKERQIAYYDKGSKTVRLPPELSTLATGLSETNVFALSRPFIFVALHEAMKHAGKSDTFKDTEFSDILRAVMLTTIDGTEFLHFIKPLANIKMGAGLRDSLIMSIGLVVKFEMEKQLEKRESSRDLRKFISIEGPVDATMIEIMVYAALKLLLNTTPEIKEKLTPHMDLIQEIADNPQLIKVNMDQMKLFEKSLK